MADFDQEMIQDFIEESRELLESIEEDFISLEKNPEDKELVNTLFRAVHTIKGTSGFLGLTSIGTLSHAMEALLSKVRDGKIIPAGPHIDALLSGADILSRMIENVYESNDQDISSEVERINALTEGKEVPQSGGGRRESPADSGQNEGSISGAGEAGAKPKAEAGNETEDKAAAGESAKASEQTDAENSAQQSESGKGKSDEILSSFVFEARKYLNNLDELLSEMADHPSSIEINSLKNIFRSISAIQGTAKYIGLKNISQLAGAMAGYFSERIQSEDTVTPEELDMMLVTKDQLAGLIDDIERSDEVDISEFQDRVITLTGTSQKKTEPPATEAPAQAPAPVIPPVKEQPEEKKEPVKKPLPPAKAHKEEVAASESIRIHVSLIDKLMRLAGELVLIRNQLLTSMGEEASGKKEVVQRLDSVTSELQEAIMKTRLQPIGTLLNKTPRAIRDLVKELGKEIVADIAGADVELDKNIIELLAGPLTHIIRNAADHGIETPEERERAGKNRQGTLAIHAYHEGGLIHISIRDDGRGINIEKVRKKAVLSGMLSPSEAAQLSENEVVNLIMAPGFSTADKVTNVSGRGVGMDVVKSSIEKLNGTIEINSVENEGTHFLLKLPLTLAIIPSLIIRSNSQSFAIPQVNLEELFSLTEDSSLQIESAGDQEIFRLRDSLLPMVRFNEILDQPSRFSRRTRHELIKKYHGDDADDNSGNNHYFAVLNSGNRRYGLIIDQVIGTEEIVVKPMHPAVKKLRIFSGATILGDGSVALILDAEGIAWHAAVDFNAEVEIEDNLKFAKAIADKAESVLLFRNGESEQFAISLHIIQRIRQISPNKIERFGTKEFINIDKRSYQVIQLENYLPVSPTEKNENMFFILFKHVGEPAGLLISELVDIKNIVINLDQSARIAEGILGSDIVDEKMTIFLDIHQLIEKSRRSARAGEAFSETELSYTESANRKDAHILIIEDSSIFRRMLSRYLEDEGFKVDIAEDGGEGLEKVKDNVYDIVISDLEMPNVNGIEFIKQLRRGSNQATVPTIALSSINSPEIIERALKAGFDRYEIKLEKDNLIKTVKSMLLARGGH